MTRWVFASVLVLGLASGAIGTRTVNAAEVQVLGGSGPGALSDEHAGGGIETCVDCHDETEKYPVLSILKTKHGMQADGRTPLGSETACETCHGPSAEHEEDSDNVQPAVAFGAEFPIGPQNDACVQCHQNGSRVNWTGSTHESENLACVSCHTVHIGEDPILSREVRPDRWVRDAQAEVCFTCHMDKRAKSFRRSTHPFRDGKASCSQCHTPHGSAGPNMLVKSTANETCYQCHAEKRGPFLWEHSPAREDCGTCHDPHGSNYQPMLKTSGPLLCQQCHMANYHPSTAYTGTGIVPVGAENKLLSKNCRNCHDEVHGSNHPSGVRWTR
jgi:DmsE family decaheme c-type cytochrome